MKKSTNLEYFEVLEGLKNVVRFKPYPKQHEPVAGHVCLAMMLAHDILNNYDLGLDKNHVLELLLYHDLAEVGMEYDIPAYSVFNDEDAKQKKYEVEFEKIKNISTKYNRPRLQELYAEFENGTTMEAKFALFCDKFEGMFNVLSKNCAGFKTEQDFEVLLTYADEYVVYFPQLQGLVDELKAHVLNLKKSTMDW